jgi:hypothetical protein
MFVVEVVEVVGLTPERWFLFELVAAVLLFCLGLFTAVKL